MLKKFYWYLFVYDLNTSSGVAADANELSNKRILRDITLLLLLSYLLLIFNSWLPLTMDALAHTFWKNEHLTSVHHVKGTSHLADELISVAKHAEKNSSAGSEKSVKYSQHVLWTICFSFTVFFLLNIIYPCFRAGNPTSYAVPMYRPPEGAIYFTETRL